MVIFIAVVIVKIDSMKEVAYYKRGIRKRTNASKK
jgi:hypothetical protein